MCSTQCLFLENREGALEGSLVLGKENSTFSPDVGDEVVLQLDINRNMEVIEVPNL